MNWILSLLLISLQLLRAYGTKSKFLTPASEASHDNLPSSCALGAQPWCALCSPPSVILSFFYPLPEEFSLIFYLSGLSFFFPRTLPQTLPCQLELVFTPSSDTYNIIPCVCFLYLTQLIEDRDYCLFISGYLVLRTVSSQRSSIIVFNFLIIIGR